MTPIENDRAKESDRTKVEEEGFIPPPPQPTVRSLLDQYALALNLENQNPESDRTFALLSIASTLEVMPAILRGIWRELRSIETALEWINQPK